MLEDLLLHEVIVVAELRFGRVPIDFVDDRLDALTGDGRNEKVVLCEMCNFVIIKIDDILGAMGDCVDVGCKEVFVLADPDNKRRALASPN